VSVFPPTSLYKFIMLIFMTGVSSLEYFLQWPNVGALHARLDLGDE
jgi:hypothetical protein